MEQSERNTRAYAINVDHRVVPKLIAQGSVVDAMKEDIEVRVRQPNWWFNGLNRREQHFVIGDRRGDAEQISISWFAMHREAFSEPKVAL